MEKSAWTYREALSYLLDFDFSSNWRETPSTEYEQYELKVRSREGTDIALFRFKRMNGASRAEVTEVEVVVFETDLYSETNFCNEEAEMLITVCKGFP